MKNTKLAFPAGTWFAVPLRKGGFARGLVARTTGTGVTFGYFFGPRAETIESLPSVAGLRPEDALLIGQFGDRGFLKGTWKAIDHECEWEPINWPLPPFIRLDDSTGKAWKTTYSDDLQVVSDEPCDPSLAEVFPKDSLMGCGFVEIKLSRILDAQKR